MALSQTGVMKLYTTVMDDVISGVRESFLDEGVDEQVLQELKSIWERKLSESKAVELNPDPPEPQPPVINYKSSSKSSKKNANAHAHTNANANANANANTSMTNVHVTPHQIIQESRSSPPAILPDIDMPTQQIISQPAPVQQIPQQLQQAQPRHQIQSQTQPPQPVRLQQAQNLPQSQQPPQQVANQPDRQVSIQIKLPGHNNLTERLVNVIVPPIAIQGNQLHSIFSGPIITAAIGLPLPYATSLLQQHVNLTYEGTPGFVPGPVNHPLQIVSQQTGTNTVSNQQLIQSVAQQQGHIAQLDGPAGDSSDDDDEEEEEENDDEEDIDEDKEDDENDAAAREEEPLNSEDDVTDDDTVDLFDTDNVVVCQYDKITRSRNKWKFYLKDGIMNLNGKDFVFQKANGDAEW